MKSDKRYAWPMCVAVGAAATACYLNSLAGDFVHDDIPAVVLNRDVLATTPIVDCLLNDFWGTPMADPHSHKSYRPLTILSFRVNFLIFGLNPFWFHVTNVLLHATASMLFTKACCEVARLESAYSILAGLLFAVHPIHTEAVSGIVGRADVLAGVLFLASLLTYNNLRRYACSSGWCHILFGGLSMLAKETGITIFIVNFVFDLYKTFPRLKTDFVDVRWPRVARQLARRTLINLASFGILVAVRVCILQGALPSFSEQDNPTAFHPSVLVRTMTFCYLAAFNWWLLLCPATLSHDWQMGSVPLVTSLADTRNLLTCLCLALIVMLFMISIFDFKHQSNAGLILGVLIMIVPFLPATNLFVTVGFVVAERILYIPSMGLILIIVTSIRYMWKISNRHRQTIVTCICLVLLTHSLRCIVRNRDWMSRETLLRAGLLTLPHNAKMHYNYANFLKDSGHVEFAKTHYYSALSLWPTYASAHNNLGTLLKNNIEAEHYFLMAIKYSKDHLNAHYNLGRLYMKINKVNESQFMLQRCLEILPHFKPAFIQLTKQSKTPAQISQLLRKVIKSRQNDPDYLEAYANWLIKQGTARLLLAQYYYLRSLSLQVRCNLSAILGTLRTFRTSGNRSRLFQFITRYHAIQRRRAGIASLMTNAYLRRWHLNHELSNHAKGYQGYRTRERNESRHPRDLAAGRIDESESNDRYADVVSERVAQIGQVLPSVSANNKTFNFPRDIQGDTVRNAGRFISLHKGLDVL